MGKAAQCSRANVHGWGCAPGWTDSKPPPSSFALQTATRAAWLGVDERPVPPANALGDAPVQVLCVRVSDDGKQQQRRV